MAVPMANPATNGRARRDHRRNTRHAHADRSPPKKQQKKKAPPRPPTSRARLPCASPRISHTPASLRLSLRTFFPDKIPDQDGGASPTKSFKTAHVYGFSTGARTPCPFNLGPRTVGSSGAAGWVRKLCFAHLRVFMAGRVASIRGCLTHVCHGRGLGRGRDQARHRTLTPAVSPCSAEAKRYDNDKVDTRASVVSRSARTGPEKNRKPAAPAGCTFRRDPPGFAWHFRKRLSKQRRKCRYARQRSS